MPCETQQGVISFSLDTALFRNPSSANMSHVRCHISGVTCQVSHVTCHVSCVMCHVSQKESPEKVLYNEGQLQPQWKLNTWTVHCKCSLITGLTMHPSQWLQQTKHGFRGKLSAVSQEEFPSSIIRHKNFRCPSVCNAETTPLGFWNKLDWRLLVKD